MPSQNNVRYSDFTTQFLEHPTTHDLGKVIDVESVRRSVRNLILTDKFERLLDPNIGSNINKLLFDPLDSTTAIVMQSYIRETIENYEPRATLTMVQCTPDYDHNSYYVKIQFNVTFAQAPVSLTMFINRIR